MGRALQLSPLACCISAPIHCIFLQSFFPVSLGYSFPRNLFALKTFCFNSMSPPTSSPKCIRDCRNSFMPSPFYCFAMRASSFSSTDGGFPCLFFNPPLAKICSTHPGCEMSLSFGEVVCKNDGDPVNLSFFSGDATARRNRRFI